MSKVSTATLATTPLLRQRLPPPGTPTSDDGSQFTDLTSNPITEAGDLVSVIIPAYNAERFIGRTLASGLSQTHDPIEVIVVDDGSVDRTTAIVEEAARFDHRVRLFRRLHSGVAKARNFAIRQARGSLIAPLDADDLWHPEKIARQVEAMRRSGPAVGVVYCWLVGIDENDAIINPRVSDYGHEGRVLPQLTETNIVGNASTPLIRR